MSISPASAISPLRITVANQASVRVDGDYVLYWMTAARRTSWNFALQRAVEWAKQLKRPLVIFEPLRCDYRWASDRFHAFVIQGMADNAAACAKAKVAYLPYIEETVGHGRGLLMALASKCCVVVGDDYPGFFLPHMVSAAAKNSMFILKSSTPTASCRSRRAWLVAHRPTFFAAFCKKISGHILTRCPRRRP